MFIGIRNNGNTTTVFSYVKNSQTRAIDTQRSFLNHKTVIFGRKTKIKPPTATLIVDVYTFTNLIHMTLHQMTVEAITELHGTLQVDLSTLTPHAQCRFLKRFMHCRHSVHVTLNIHHCQTYAVVCQTLIDFELLCQNTSNMEMDIVLLLFHFDKLAHTFDYTSKHRSEFD